MSISGSESDGDDLDRVTTEDVRAFITDNNKNIPPPSWKSLEDVHERRHEEIVWRQAVTNKHFGSLVSKMDQMEKRFEESLERVESRLNKITNENNDLCQKINSIEHTMTSTYLMVDVMMRHAQRMEERYKLKMEQCDDEKNVIKNEG